MKKILLFAVATIALVTSVQAQIEKGSVLLGGNLNFGTNKSESIDSPDQDKYETTSFGITPSVGIAIKANTILGISLGYSNWESQSKPANADQENTNYGTEVFIRRYLTLGKGFYLFAQPGIYFNRNILEIKYPTSEQTNKGWNAGISLFPGISYAVTKRFHLEAGLGNIANLSYSKNKTEHKTVSTGELKTSKGSGFSISSSLSSSSPISIGIRFFLPRKAKA